MRDSTLSGGYGQPWSTSSINDYRGGFLAGDWAEIEERFKKGNEINISYEGRS